VISRPIAQKALARFVHAELWLDRPPHADANRRLQVERFRTVGAIYVVLSPDGRTELARVTGTVCLGQFLDFLERGRSGSFRKGS
jgi:hypothetical protein